MGRQRKFTAEQRAELVLRMLSKEEPTTVLARRTGVSEQTLYRWREEFFQGGVSALKGHGSESEVARELKLKLLQAQLAQRDRFIDKLVANRFK